MTDLVQRLRKSATWVKALPSSRWAPHRYGLLTEAADEIERLNKLNSEMSDLLREGTPLFGKCAIEIEKLADPSNWRGTWHVRHADGTTEDIVLDHGNLLEDSRGTAGQFILNRRLDE